MIGNENLRLLGVYYSAQNVFKDDLSAPLLNDVRPVINVNEHSLSLLVEKILPNLEKRVSHQRVEKSTKKVFRQIDSGKIDPKRIIGSHLDADQIVKNAYQHDSYKALYRTYFNELTLKNRNCVNEVRNLMVDRVLNDEFDLNGREKKMMKNALLNLKKRPPISLELETMKNFVDVMHETVENCCGPSIADKVLTNALKRTEGIPLNFSTRNFI